MPAETSASTAPALPAAVSISSSRSERSPRLPWIDNLRTFVIFLVVNMHACVTYSHVGSWYLNEPPEPGPAVKIAFVFWQGHLQAFFMGLLFFIAGVFAPGSLARRGPAAFLRERFIRLGLPALLYMLVINPFMLFILLASNRTPGELARKYLSYITSERVLRGSGPLWFALALLLFSLVFVLVQTLRGEPAAQPAERASFDKSGFQLMGLAGILILSTFLIRIVQPIGTSISNFQLCFFPQYIIAFSLGIAAGRAGWLDTLARSKFAKQCGLFGLIGGPLLLAQILYTGNAASGDFSPFVGGLRFEALGLAFWEQLTGLLLAFGLLYLFRARVNLWNAFTRWTSDRAFAVYVLHAPVLVALTFVLRPLHPNPFTGALLLTALGILASFLLADLARRIPALGKIL